VVLDALALGLDFLAHLDAGEHEGLSKESHPGFSAMPPLPFSCYPDSMESNTYHVQADWDPEAGVWVATSVDVPGLATEAETIEGLTNRLRTIIPELLEANGR